MEDFVIGVDFVTNSVRSILVNARNGTEIAASVFLYPRRRRNAMFPCMEQHMQIILQLIFPALH